MKNKNLTYIALGIGAGIVAYYLFCRKKSKIEVQEIVEEKPKVQEPIETKRRGAIGGGISVPAQPMMGKPTYTTPVATTTPLNVTVTTTSTPIRTEPVIAGEIKLPTPTPTPTPTLKPVLVAETIEKPIVTTTTKPVLDESGLNVKPITTTTTPVLDESGLNVKPITTTTTPVVSREEIASKVVEQPLMIQEKPILTSTAVKETITPQITQTELTRKLAFDGSKSMAFEVGGCLYDL